MSTDSCETQKQEAMACLAMAKAKVLSFVKAPFSCRNLGVDFLAGKSKRRLSLPTRDARYRAMQKRAKRLCCLRTSSKRLASKVFIAGILPSILYDSPVLGLFGTHLKRAKGKAAHYLGFRGPFRSAALAFALRPEVDPEVVALGALVGRYAKELWLASEKQEYRDPMAIRLGTLGVGISAFLRTFKGPLGSPAGPLQAVFSAFAKAGWSSDGPFRINTARGDNLDLTKVCPSRITKIFKNDLVLSLAGKAVSKLHDKSPTHESAAIFESGMFLEPLISFCKHKDRLTSSMVNKFVSGGIVTDLRLCVLGYDVDPSCKRCGLALDTLHHRLYTCSHNERNAAINLGTSLWNRAVDAGDGSLAFTRGLLPMPKVDRPSTTTKVEYINFGADSWFQPQDGKLFSDGSCSNPRHASLARAGFALCQIDSEGEITKAIYGSMPRRLAQTPLQGEASAMEVALETAHDTILATDCELIASEFQKGIVASSSCSSSIADMWRQVSHTRNMKAISNVCKVKAHRSLEDILSGNDMNDFLGNNAADKLAKMGAELDAVKPEQLKEFSENHAMLKKILFHMVDTLRDWPRTPKATRTRSSMQAAKNMLDNQDRHVFVPKNDRWWCLKCARVTSRPQLISRISKCMGKSFVSDLIAQSNGHVLFFSRQLGGGILVFCNVCGAFAHTSPKLLKEQCRGPPACHDFGRVVLSRTSACYHPTSGLPIGKPLKLE